MFVIKQYTYKCLVYRDSPFTDKGLKFIVNSITARLDKI